MDRPEAPAADSARPPACTPPGLRPERSTHPTLLGLLVLTLLLNGLWVIEGRSDPRSEDVYHLLNALMPLVGDWPDPGQTGYPPLVYLVTYPFLLIFGTHEVTFFLVQAFFLTILVLATERCGTLLWNREVGFLSALVLLSSAQATVAVRSFHLDYPQAALWMLQFVFYLESDGFRRWWPSWGFGILTAAGMLVKWSYPLFAAPFLAWVLVRQTLAAARGPGGLDRLRRVCLPVLMLLNALALAGSRLSGMLADHGPLSWILELVIAGTGLFSLLHRPIRGAERLVRFLTVTGAGVAAGSLVYARYLPASWGTNCRGSLSWNQPTTGDGPVFSPVLAALEFLVKLKEERLLPILFALLMVGVVLTLVLPQARRRNAEILFLVVLPGVLAWQMTTPGAPRYYAPLLGFECILACFWLPRLGAIRWLPVGLVVVTGLCLNGGWLTGLPLPQADSVVVGEMGAVRDVTARSTPTRLSELEVQSVGGRLLSLASPRSAWSTSLLFTLPPCRVDWSFALEEILDRMPLPPRGETRILLLVREYADQTWPFFSSQVSTAIHQGVLVQAHAQGLRVDRFLDPKANYDLVLVGTPTKDARALPELQRQVALALNRALVRVHRFQRPDSLTLDLLQVGGPATPPGQATVPADSGTGRTVLQAVPPENS